MGGSFSHCPIRAADCTKRCVWFDHAGNDEHDCNDCRLVSSLEDIAEQLKTLAAIVELR